MTFISCSSNAVTLHTVGSFVFTKETAQRLPGSFEDDFQRVLLTRKFLHADIQKNSFGRRQSMPISAFKKSLTALLEVGTLFMEAYKSLKESYSYCIVAVI